VIQQRGSFLVLQVVAAGVLILAVGMYVLPLVLWIVSLTARSAEVPDARAAFWSVAPYTFAVSLGSAILATVMGWIVAVLFVFSGRYLRIVILLTISAPLIVGFLARNFSWIGLLSTFSLLNWLLYTTPGVVLVLSTVFAPFAFFLTVPGMDWLRPIHFEAARTLGVSHAGTLHALVVPAAWRSILLSIVLTFVLAIGYFVTPRMIGGGRHDFVGNGIVTIMDYGEVARASKLAIYLLVTASLPITVIIFLSLRRRSLILGHR